MIPSSPTRPAQKAEMSTITCTYYLDLRRQGDIIKHVGINQGIVSSEEDVTRNGQARHERGGTALAVVVERIPETTLRRRVVFVEGVDRQLCREFGAWQIRKAVMPVADLGT